MREGIFRKVPERLLALLGFVDGKKRFTTLRLDFDEESVVITVDKLTFQINFGGIQQVENLLNREAGHGE